MRVDRGGATRIVLVFKSFVIKVPHYYYAWYNFLQGLVANMTEARTWKHRDYNNGQDLLCPVLWSSWGGWILIMPKAEVFKDSDVFDMSEHIKYFPGDDKPNNYGLLNGKIVKLDYGNN